MSDIQTPPEGTEEQATTPVTVAEPETPQAPVEAPQDSAPQPQEQQTVPKDKFVASAQESILNAERVKVRDQKIESLTKTDTPTDEAMRLVYPEWDQLDAYNKNVLVQIETTKMQNARVLADQQDIKERQKLEDELENILEINPKLKGKESEFKRFAKNPKNKGISADVLAKAFLFDVELEPSAVPKVQEALPTGSGGPRDPLGPKKMTIEAAAELRKTNYKAYKEALDAGLVEELE
jgi:hypothetical protein